MESSLTVRGHELRIERPLGELSVRLCGMVSPSWQQILSSLCSVSRVRSETSELMCGWLPPFYSSGVRRFTKKGLSKYYKHFQGLVNQEQGARGAQQELESRRQKAILPPAICYRIKRINSSCASKILPMIAIG